MDRHKAKMLMRIHCTVQGKELYSTDLYWTNTDGKHTFRMHETLGYRTFKAYFSQPSKNWKPNSTN